jgi:hypothetical protein
MTSALRLASRRPGTLHQTSSYRPPAQRTAARLNTGQATRKRSVRQPHTELDDLQAPVRPG